MKLTQSEATRTQAHAAESEVREIITGPKYELQVPL